MVTIERDVKNNYYENKQILFKATETHKDR